MYKTLIGDVYKEGMALMMGNYVYSKHHKNEYADLLPLIMSNALQFEIIVIEFIGDAYKEGMALMMGNFYIQSIIKKDMLTYYLSSCQMPSSWR